MKSKFNFSLKSHFEKMLKAFWKKSGKPTKRKPSQHVNKTADDWRENVMRLRDGLYQRDTIVQLVCSLPGSYRTMANTSVSADHVVMPGCDDSHVIVAEKIDLVSRTEGIAYELKTSGLYSPFQNFTHLLSGSVNKVARFNEKSKFKIQMLAFITDKTNVKQFKTCRKAREILEKAAKGGLGVEIIGV